ncbi:MAG: tRNA preQ1(34) S-adenosylmethionine ribosyltransferase-isomerase QueA [Acidimicrobiales bacterium]
MKAAEFDYDLPKTAIAQEPAQPRDSSRLLVVDEPVRHLITRDLSELVQPGDVLVVNETRVLPARLNLFKETGGRAEVLALEPADEGWWKALVRPSRRVRPGTLLREADGGAVLEVGDDLGSGVRLVRSVLGNMLGLLDHLGSVPLPPYIETDLDDPQRYQTVFANQPGSVAAPTAGLHITDDVLDACQAKGAELAKVELRVGLGTFRPIESEDIEGHHMHTELYQIPKATWERCGEAQRVVAVGTTVVRALEAAASSGDLSGETDLFIQPGYDFRVVDALMTNFHTPRSTLLVMVEAFMGPRWREVYTTALVEGYRFLSFGDAMFVERMAK